MNKKTAKILKEASDCCKESSKLSWFRHPVKKLKLRLKAIKILHDAAKIV